jgi:hypothetical protein
LGTSIVLSDIYLSTGYYLSLRGTARQFTSLEEPSASTENSLKLPKDGEDGKRRHFLSRDLLLAATNKLLLYCRGEQQVNDDEGEDDSDEEEDHDREKRIVESFDFLMPSKLGWNAQ